MNKLFISGPVVVSPSNNIVFKTIIPKSSNVADAKWMIRRDPYLIPISFGKPGYSSSTFCGVVQTQTMSIPNVQENIGQYQLYLNNLKSNIINVFAYGNNSLFQLYLCVSLKTGFNIHKTLKICRSQEVFN